MSDLESDTFSGTSIEPREARSSHSDVSADPLDGDTMTQDDFDDFDEAGLDADRDAPQGSNVWTATFIDSLRDRGFTIVRSAVPSAGADRWTESRPDPRVATGQHGGDEDVRRAPDCPFCGLTFSEHHDRPIVTPTWASPPDITPASPEAPPSNYGEPLTPHEEEFLRGAAYGP